MTIPLTPEQKLTLKALHYTLPDKIKSRPIKNSLFLNGVHPQHNTGTSKAWIEKVKERFTPCNTRRQRLNINGAYDPITNNVIITQGDCINSENTIELFLEY
jgi:hypothetical protein